MDKDYFLKRLGINQPSAFESYSYDLLPKTFLAHDKVPIECYTHGVFYQKACSHVSSKNGCWFCAESKGERAVEIFLKKYGIDYIREYRILPYLYRYDFYLPELNIYIEFNGLQHYTSVAIFGGQEAYMNTKERDEIKRLLVKQNNGELIVITYLNLNDDSVEKEMIRRLKKLYVRWYIIDGKLKVFKTLDKVCNFFNIPLSVLTKNLDFEIKKTVKDFSILF